MCGHFKLIGWSWTDYIWGWRNQVSGDQNQNEAKSLFFYYVVWEESERHSVDFLLKIIPAKELVLWADGAVSFPAKESSEIVHAIIFNGLCGDLLNLWENVSSFVKAGCIHIELGFQKYRSQSCQWLHSYY